MENGFEPLSEDDVVSMTSGQILISHSTFKVSEFMVGIKSALSLSDELTHKWLGKGHTSFQSRMTPCESANRKFELLCDTICFVNA